MIFKDKIDITSQKHLSYTTSNFSFAFVQTLLVTNLHSTTCLQPLHANIKNCTILKVPQDFKTIKATLNQIQISSTFDVADTRKYCTV